MPGGGLIRIPGGPLTLILKGKVSSAEAHFLPFLIPAFEPRFTPAERPVAFIFRADDMKFPVAGSGKGSRCLLLAVKHPDGRSFLENKMDRASVCRTEAQDPFSIGRAGQDLEGARSEPFDPVHLAFKGPVVWKDVFPSQGFHTFLVKLFHLVGMSIFKLPLMIEGVAVEEVDHFGVEGYPCFGREIARQDTSPVIDERKVRAPVVLPANDFPLELDHVALSGYDQFVGGVYQGIAHSGLVGLKLEGTGEGRTACGGC